MVAGAPARVRRRRFAVTAGIGMSGQFSGASYTCPHCGFDTPVAGEFCTMCGRALPPVDRSAYLPRSEEHTSELQSRGHLVCRLLLEKKKRTPHLNNPQEYYSAQ